MTQQEVKKILINHIAQLSEHFGVCAITVSWEEEGRTFYADISSGNKYAVVGMLDRHINAVTEDYTPLEGDGVAT